jgi:hypothetical protein
LFEEVVFHGAERSRHPGATAIERRLPFTRRPLLEAKRRFQPSLSPWSPVRTPPVTIAQPKTSLPLSRSIEQRRTIYRPPALHKSKYDITALKSHRSAK